MGADSAPTVAFPIPPNAHEPVLVQHTQAQPPRAPEADATTTQANRKLAWLLAGVVAVAGGLLIVFLRANTPANAPATLVTPQPATEQDTPSAQPPSQPLMTSPEPTSTPTAPPRPPVKKVAPKPVVRSTRPRVSAKATTTSPITDPTETTSPNTDSTSKNTKGRSSKKSLLNDG